MKLKVLLLTALLAIAVRPAFAAQNHEKDVSAIRQVMEAFRLAIIERDRSSFTALFFSPDPRRVNWQFVNEDARMARLQAIKPDAKKSRYIPAFNYLNFIDSVVSNKNASEEVFSNVKIDTDGEIASVGFDYSYLVGDKQTNWGREMWQLVRTENGWKIISVIWTIRDPRAAS